MTDEIPTQHYDDEIDLVELLEALWAEKRLILAATVLSVLGVLGIQLTSTPVFEVRAPYFIKVAHIGCGLDPLGADKCEIESQIPILSNDRWLSDDEYEYLSHTTEAPKSATDYQYELTALNQALRSVLLKDAEVMADMIENEIASVTDITGVSASNLLYAKQVMHHLEGEATPLRFGSVTIESNQNFGLLRVAAAFFGAMMGSFIVLFRNTLRHRRAVEVSIGH